jgi:3-oxoadipate enol-lactonase
VRIAAGELDVAYDDVAAGPPVVLVHGGLGSRAMWAPQVRVLRRSRRVIAYDLRGHGETRGGEDVRAFTPALLRDDCLAFADALGLDAFALVGLSVGGFVAQEVAIAAPNRITKLVLADTWAITTPSERGRRLAHVLTPVVEGALRALGTAPLAALAARGMGAGNREAAELVREATAGTSREAAIRVWRGLGAHDTVARLERIAAPTLVLIGAHDANREQARLLADRIPDARLVVLADAEHNSNLRAPGRFTAELERFLPLP